MGNKLSRRAFLGTAAATGWAAAAGGRARAGAPPPNVVYIVCDQMRAGALGCLGNPNAHTPHLDRLAARGVCCTGWFSNNPVCAPSRATAFTGLYPHEHGRTTNHNGAPPDRLEGTLLGHFAARGYRLGWVGKNHTYANPVLRRLDFYRERNREPFRKYPPLVPPWWHGSLYWPEDDCYAPQNTRDALAFLDSQPADQPFFLHVNYFDPHPPYFAPSATLEVFNSREMRLPPPTPPAALSPRLAAYARAMAFDAMTGADLRQTMRHYHAAIAWGVDAQVGALVDALEARGLLDNTILLFTSDHGDFMGDYGMVRKGMFHYDALLRVPMIWHAPRLFPGGRTLDAEGAHVDLFPTLAELTGGPAPARVSGRSYAPLLRGEEAAGPRTVFASATYGDLPAGYFDAPAPLVAPSREQPLHKVVMDQTTAGTRRTAMVRTRDWKYIRNETGGDELYALAGGPERENVLGAPAHHAVEAALRQQVEAFWPWA